MKLGRFLLVEFRYLGTMLNMLNGSNEVEKEIYQRIQAGNRAYFVYKDTLKKMSNMISLVY